MKFVQKRKGLVPNGKGEWNPGRPRREGDSIGDIVRPKGGTEVVLIAGEDTRIQSPCTGRTVQTQGNVEFLLEGGSSWQDLERPSIGDPSKVSYRLSAIRSASGA